MVLLTATRNESDVKINDVGGVTHIRTLARFCLHKQSLETPTQFDYPPFLVQPNLFFRNILIKKELI